MHTTIMQTPVESTTMYEYIMSIDSQALVHGTLNEVLCAVLLDGRHVSR